MDPAGRPLLSVVIPARDAAVSLPRCLAAVRKSARSLAEVIVVDDGSTDESAEVAGAHGAAVLRQPISAGPAGARNAGARRAAGEIILFLDADIELAEDAIARVLQAFSDDPGLAAVFGSYDDAPASRAFVSDYRNLLHHFVHQTSREDSESFWAGCGAVRKDVFLSVGGFDERYQRPSIEDIELGGRLVRAGHRVRLDKRLRGTHLKRWTLARLLLVDIRDRAYPWARLLLQRGRIPDDLNLQYKHRASAVLVSCSVVVTTGLVAAGSGRVGALLAVAATAGGILLLNRGFYRFLVDRRGVPFAAGAFGLHVLYYAYAGATFAWCWACHRVRAVVHGVRRYWRPRAAQEASPHSPLS
jgi:GT2 family glycosyltransferase